MCNSWADLDCRRQDRDRDRDERSRSLRSGTPPGRKPLPGGRGLGRPAGQQLLSPGEWHDTVLGRDGWWLDAERSVRRAVHPRLWKCGDRHRPTAAPDRIPRLLGSCRLPRGVLQLVPEPMSARLTAKLDLGNLEGLYPPPNPPGGPPALGPLRAGDVEVRFMLGRSDGSIQCNDGNNCDVGPTDATATGSGVTYTTSGTSSSPHLQIPPSRCRMA